MTSNRPLNSKEALEESTATSSSVMLSGARREKVGLDIIYYSRDPRNSQQGIGGRRSEVRGQKSDQREVFKIRMTSAIACGVFSDRQAGLMKLRKRDD